VAALICGVDVSSISLDARVGAQGAEARFANNPEGVAGLIAFCQHQGIELVAMEATGGYERLSFGLLWGSGIAVALLNPRAVRRFAQGMGLDEKTDRIDAGVIAWFAEVKKVVPSEPASAAQVKLKALVTRLRQLTELRAAQRNQRLLVSEPSVLDSFGELLALLTAQIRALEKAIAELIAADPLWRQLEAAFRSIKGVAGRTVSRLMAEMPEIGTASNKAVSKLAGLAPLAQDSGKSQGKRMVRGGRGNVRTILYVVADIVRRYNADFQAFADRLRAAGKPKRVVRIALAHKLLVRLNAKAREVRQQYSGLGLGLSNG
jgi:transposase